MAKLDLELLHAAPSYYSMLARLALVEANLPFRSHLIDIHFAKQQLSDGYRLINPAMTVPTLRTTGAVWGSRVLVDSREILAFAAQAAGDGWLDADPGCLDRIAAVVAGHYAISIENLTFGKAVLSIPLLRRVVPRLLGSLVAGLERRAAIAVDGGASLRAKAEQNRSRLAYFSQGSQADKLLVMRDQVRGYVDSLPRVESGAYLFGNRPSSADVVVAVLFARLEMIQELDLSRRPDLLGWWRQFQERSSFRRAEIWTHFRRRRFVLAIFVAAFSGKLIPT